LACVISQGIGAERSPPADGRLSATPLFPQYETWRACRASGRRPKQRIHPDKNLRDVRVTRVLSDVTWAEAFILASPDYHGTMSGAMKNFLDYHWPEFSGKLFGYLCSSHEKGITVMEGMRLAVRQCYGWSLPYGLALDDKHDLDANGRIKNPALQSRLRMAARDLVIYGSLLYTQFIEDIARNIPETFAARYA